MSNPIHKNIRTQLGRNMSPEPEPAEDRATRLINGDVAAAEHARLAAESLERATAGLRTGDAHQGLRDAFRAKSAQLLVQSVDSDGNRA